MPPAQMRVPLIKQLLGDATNAQYNSMKDLRYQLIVSIGFYHMWYYDIPDRGRIWTIIFRIVHANLPAIVANPRPGVAGPRHIRLAVYNLFLVCQKCLLGNKDQMFKAYSYEYDRCMCAGYDSYTCHPRGIYAGYLAWAPHNPGTPMGAPLPQLPILVVPSPFAAPLGIGDELRTERGPPRANLAPPVLYLPANFAYWENRFSGRYSQAICLCLHLVRKTR